MVITVFGLGFVGLTTALGFSKIGHKVYGVDVNKERLDLIRNGEVPFLEPGLPEVLSKTLNKNFFVDFDIDIAIKESKAIYFCVGTPYGEDGEADLQYLYKAIDETLKYIDDTKFRVLVTKSTIPPSTTKEKIIPYIKKKGYVIGEKIGVANNPEFLREGYCYDDFMNADRIVIGTEDEKSKEICNSIYKDFKVPIHNVSLNCGEFIKYLSNTFLATLISYANEMSLLAGEIGDINISKAFKILHEDRRWNNGNMASYFYPGCGYGGYCLPKDTNALYALSKRKDFNSKILKAVIDTNDEMPNKIVEIIKKNVTKQNRIGILGLSFKPNSDDVRDTPAAKVIKKLIEDDYINLVAYDPVATEEFRRVYKYNLEYKDSLMEIEKDSDILVILTAWKEFEEVDKSIKILDFRYML